MKEVRDEFGNLIYTDYNKGDYDKNDKDSYCCIVTTETDNLKRLHQATKEMSQALPYALGLGVLALACNSSTMPGLSDNVLTGAHVISAMGSISACVVAVAESITAHRITKRILNRQADNLDKYAAMNALPDRLSALDDITAKTGKIFDDIELEK